MIRFVNIILLVFFCVTITDSSVVHAQFARVGEKNKQTKYILPSYLQYKVYKSASTDYSIAHRNQEEILSWVSRNVANLLTFDARGIEEHFKGIRPLFTDIGWREFVSYVKGVQLRKVVIERSYALNSIVDRYMFVRRHGAVVGVYRWLVEVPVLMSFYQQDLQGRVNGKISASARISVSVTITRVTEGGGADQIAIAGWKVTQRGVDDKVK